MRAGLSQILAALGALILGLLLPKATSGPQISSGAAQPFLFAMAGGLVSFIALVFSLLFLQLQFAATTLTPRLTVFRDDPRVWRAFATFVGAFVFAATAGLQIGDDVRTSALVPALAITLVLVSLILARNVQLSALRLLQMNTTLDELRAQGAKVIDALYTAEVSSEPHDRPTLPPETQSVRWNKAGTLLQRVDLAGLRQTAADAGVVVAVHVTMGGELRRGEPVFTVYGGRAPVEEGALVRHLQTGPDRTFAQDPLLAFRLLSDIAIRALSTAVNDPASAVSAIAGIDDLLRLIADRELDVGLVSDARGNPVVVLRLPTWEEFLQSGVDDVLPYAASAPMAAARLAQLLDDLEPLVSTSRQPALVRRRDRLHELAVRGDARAHPQPGPTTLPG
jgi:uncharacterized membrane protein